MAIRDRYPGADILRQRGHWDQETRRVVMDRVHNVPSTHNLEAHQRATLDALCERVIPQSHRPEERRVPIAPWIDQTCDTRVLEGFRFEDMPTNTVAWQRGLEGLDQTSQAMYGRQFISLEDSQRDEVLQAIRGGNPPGEVWQQMPARRWWISVALRQITGIYFAHPHAWDEIGFGGPAYPRGYFALNHGAPEPWETREVPAERQKDRR